MTSSALQQLTEIYNHLYCSHNTKLSPAEVAEVLLKQQSDRNEILLQLSTVRVLFSESPNEERAAVCEAMTTTTADILYSNLVCQLKSNDQLICFTASKAMCAVLTYPDLNLKLEWLNTILDLISPGWISTHVALYSSQILTEQLKCLRKRQQTCATMKDSRGERLAIDKLKVCFAALEFSWDNILQTFTMATDHSNTLLELSLGEFLSLTVEILRHKALTPSLDSGGGIPSPSVIHKQIKMEHETEQLLPLGKLSCGGSKPQSPLLSCQHKITSHLYQITSLFTRHCSSILLLKKLIDIFIKVVRKPTVASDEASQLHLSIPILLKSNVVSKAVDSWMQDFGISLVRDSLSTFLEVEKSSRLTDDRVRSADSGLLNTVARKLALFFMEFNGKYEGEHTVPWLDLTSQQVQGSLASAGIIIPQEVVPPVIRHVLFQVLSEQDDCIVEALIACCRIYRQILLTQSWSSDVDTPTVQQLFSRVFNAHSMFVEFLGSISYDHSVLLDFLMSPESRFADFLREYLQVAVSDWSGLEMACEEYDVRAAQCDSEASGLPSWFEIKAYREDVSRSSKCVPATKKAKVDLPMYGSTADTNSDVCSSEARSDCTSDSEVGYSASDHQLIAINQSSIDRSSDCSADSDSEKDPSFQETVLDKFLGCCIRLKFSLVRLHSKGLFPYTVKDIIPLLESLENKYEVG